MITFTLIFFYFLYNLLLCIQPIPQINYTYNMKMTKKNPKNQIAKHMYTAKYTEKSHSKTSQHN